MDDHGGEFVIPVTIDDLAANGLLGEAHPQQCWERSVETLVARKDEIAGLAVASDERIEAYVLYASRSAGAGGEPPVDQQTGAPGVEILALRSCIEDDGGARSRRLLARLGANVAGTFRFPKVHPAEISKELLETLGFRPAGGHRLYGATARPD